MTKLYILIITAFQFCSCEIKVKTSNTKFEGVGAIFLNDLYHRRTQSCIRQMDRRFISLAKDKNINLDSGMNVLADNLRDEFKGEISATLVRYKDTLFESTRSTYLKYQVSSSRHTGYYNFYVNNNNGKIILISKNQDND